MRLLMIEDNNLVSMSVQLILGAEQCEIELADTGEYGIELAKIYDYDLILLDLNLPDMNGADVLRSLRSSGVRTPVIVLSGEGETVTKVKALAAGADDYVTKPFHREEFVARIKTLVRRSQGHAHSQIKVGEMVLDLNSRTISVRGEHVHLTNKEYQVLELLVLRKGGTVTKEALLAHLYGGMDEPETKIIDVFVCKLRKKLGSAGGIIQTVWGRGLMLDDAPPTVLAA